jgi:dCMP deaminase
MSVALAVEQRSRCSRAQVGAVIVTSDNRVVSSSYNGPPKGLKVQGTCDKWCPRAMGETELGADYSACESIHAEENAIARADFSQSNGGTIYVTRSSCINCARLIANAGIARLVHRVTERDAHRNPEDVEQYLEKIGVEVLRG